jgi:Family of unknown function (DUF6879)
VTNRIEAGAPAFRRLFKTFTRSAWRLEGRQTYNSPGEAPALARFLAGEQPQLDTSWWESMLAANTAQGRTVGRVRILVEPPTDYTRFELACYPQIAAAGEDIRIIAVRAGDWPPGLPHDHDYWLFDEHDVWAMEYDDAGRFIGCTLLEEPSEIEQHIQWRDLALAQSVPLASYTGSRAHAS